MKKIFKKIYYFGGTIYRGMIGRYHNAFDKCPEINQKIDWFSIGQSVNGAQIKCYKINEMESKEYGLNNNNNNLLIVGGIHGNEVGTVKLANKIINYFNSTKVPVGGLEPTKDVSWCRTKFFVIPVLNIDGYMKAITNPDYSHRGKIGRFNANNVDLNRNFPTENFQSKSVWKTGKNYSENNKEVFCGEYGASELETQALIKFIQEKGIKNLIMLHNVGKDVMINKDDEVAEKWAEIYNKYSKFKKRYDMNLNGGASDWAKENGIHFMAVEGGSRWGSDWGRQKNSMQKILENMDS